MFFPASGLDTRSQRSSALLQAANGSAIHTYGDKLMTLCINGRKFLWKFIIADVTQPLLGADFLSANTLMVDVKGQRLVDPTTYMSCPLHITNASTHGIHNVVKDKRLFRSPHRVSRYPYTIPSLTQLLNMGSFTTSLLKALQSTVVHAGFHQRN